MTPADTDSGRPGPEAPANETEGEATAAAASAGPVDVLVTGRSLAALAAALDCATLGLSVRVLLPELGDELPDEGVRDPEGAIAALAEELGLPALETSAPAAVRLRVDDVRAALGPADAVFGIPVAPLASAVAGVIGWPGAFRAYLDRLRPVLTIGKTQFLGELVEQRQGAGVRLRLVEPLVRARFGAPAERVEVAVALPGLNEAMTVAGSLSGAALALTERFVARETLVRPAGGWSSLRTALHERLRHFGAELVPGEADTVERTATGWAVTGSDGSRHRARSLIVGAALPDDAVPAAERFLTVPQSDTRVYAETDMSGEIPAGPRYAGTVDRGPLAGSSVTMTPTGGGAAWRIGLPRADSAVAAPSGAELSRVAADAASLLGLAGTPAPGSWRIRRAFAPDLGLEAAHAREATLAALAEAEPALLPAGERWSGGELSAALLAARSAAVPLRRALTGIA